MINALQDRLKDVESRLGDLETSLTVRDIGSQADIALMNFVFQNARSAPYMIRSFKNLRKFLEAPQKAMKNKICGPGAFEAYSRLAPVDASAIASRLEFVNTFHPDAENMVNILKKEGDAVAYRRAKSDEEIQNLVQDDPLLRCAVDWAISLKNQLSSKFAE